MQQAAAIRDRNGNSTVSIITSITLITHAAEDVR